MACLCSPTLLLKLIFHGHKWNGGKSPWRQLNFRLALKGQIHAASKETCCTIPGLDILAPVPVPLRVPWILWFWASDAGFFYHTKKSELTQLRLALVPCPPCPSDDPQLAVRLQGFAQGLFWCSLQHAQNLQQLALWFNNCSSPRCTGHSPCEQASWQSSACRQLLAFPRWWQCHCERCKEVKPRMPGTERPKHGPKDTRIWFPLPCTTLHLLQLPYRSCLSFGCPEYVNSSWPKIEAKDLKNSRLNKAVAVDGVKRLHVTVLRYRRCTCQATMHNSTQFTFALLLPNRRWHENRALMVRPICCSHENAKMKLLSSSKSNQWSNSERKNASSDASNLSQHWCSKISSADTTDRSDAVRTTTRNCMIWSKQLLDKCTAASSTLRCFETHSAACPTESQGPASRIPWVQSVSIPWCKHEGPSNCQVTIRGQIMEQRNVKCLFQWSYPPSSCICSTLPSSRITPTGIYNMLPGWSAWAKSWLRDFVG